MKYLLAYIRRIIRRIREGRLKELFSQWRWMARYIRKFWLLIGGYTFLNMTGSVLGLGTSLVSQTLIDSVTGHNSGMLGIAAAAYVGVGVGQIFISAVRSRASLKINLHISNKIRLDIFDQIIQTDWESLSEFRPGDLQYRLNGDVMVVINNILTFIPSLCSMLVSFGGAFVVMMQNDPVMAAIALCGPLQHHQDAGVPGEEPGVCQRQRLFQPGDFPEYADHQGLRPGGYLYQTL